MIQEKFFQDLAEIMDELHGDSNAVIDEWYNRFGSELSPYDKEIVGNGEPRWRNSLRWAIKKMKEAGLVKPTDQQKGRGKWELVDKFPGFWTKVRELDKKYVRGLKY